MLEVVRRVDGAYNLVLKNPNQTEDKPFIYDGENLVIGISTAGLEGLKLALDGWEKLIPTSPDVNLIHKALSKYPDKVKEYKEGNTALLGLFMGEIMKESTEEPETVKQLLELVLERV